MAIRHAKWDFERKLACPEQQVYGARSRQATLRLFSLL
jgi:hypothetical protein